MSDLSVVGRLKLLEKQFVLDGRLSDANTVQMAVGMIEMLKDIRKDMENHNLMLEQLVQRQSMEILKLEHNIPAAPLTSHTTEGK